MHIRTLIAALAIAAAWPAAAAADWQYTKWNMTPQQVIKAGQGAPKPVSGEEAKQKQRGKSIVKLKAPFKSGNMSFMAYFHFDPKTDGLVMVVLSIDEVGQGGYLRAQLMSKYGEPNDTQIQEFSQTGFYTWLADDLVTLMISDSFANLFYEPRVNPNNQGL